MVIFRSIDCHTPSSVMGNTISPDMRIPAFCQFCRSENDIAISLDGCYLRNELIRQYLLRVAKFGTPQLCSKYDPKEKGGPMNESTIKIRLMQADDFDAVVGPD